MNTLSVRNVVTLQTVEKYLFNLLIDAERGTS